MPRDSSAPGKVSIPSLVAVPPSRSSLATQSSPRFKTQATRKSQFIPVSKPSVPSTRDSAHLGKADSFSPPSK